MTEWRRRFKKYQEIFTRSVLTILGIVALVIAFYSVSLKELMLTDKDVSLGPVNYILAAISVLCIWAAFDLERFNKIVDFIGQKFGFKKKNSNTQKNENDAV